ncbi:Longin-like domain-containing protein [Biscogniauxia marginata]|nr:Longin-like domain-containing protein [Biscogniauxia marginata]
MAIAIPSIACLGVIGRHNNPLHITIFPSYDGSTHTLAPLRTPLQFSLLLSSTLDVFEFRVRHARAANSTATGLISGDFGLLHAVDDRLACYGFETNTGVKFIAVVDMRGRVPGIGFPTAVADKRASGMRSPTGTATAAGGGGAAAAAAAAGPGSAIGSFAGGAGSMLSGITGGAAGTGAGAGTGTGAGTAGVGAGAAGVASGVGLRDTELKVVFRAMQTAYVRLLQNPFYDPEETGSFALALGGRGVGGKRITSRRFADEMRRIGESWAPGVTSL